VSSGRATPKVRIVACLAALLLSALAYPDVRAEPQQQEHPWQQMQEHAFDVGAGGTLRVHVDDADVAVVAASGGNATIDIRLRSNDMERARDLFERTGYTARQDGNTIIVESGTRPDDDWRQGFWMSVVVETRVPKRFDLDLSTEDGDVSLASHEGRVRVDTEDGDIVAGELIGAPSSLRASIDLSGEDVSIQGGSRIDGDVRDGRAQGDLNGGGERIRARTGDGTVRLVEGSNG